MNKSFIDQLFGFIATPVCIVGLTIGIVILILATKYRSIGWFTFSLFGFATSLGAYKDFWHKVTPPLVFPLQQLRSSGRPLSIVLLIMLVILALNNQPNWRQQVLPKAINYILFVQGVIVFKTLLYGNQEFAILSGLTFGGIIFVLQRGVGNWLEDDENFYLAVRSIGTSAAIFIAVNAYQFVRDRYAVTFTHGRFLGTTGNPQHAAILLAAAIPCLMFLLQRHSRWNPAKIMWGVTLLLVMYFLILTGSRNGVLMAIVSIGLFFRNNGAAWFRLLLTAAIVGGLVLTFVQPQTLNSSSSSLVDANVSERFTDTNNNTRIEVSAGLWNSFQENPLFGTPLEKGGRLGYGENSWLSAGATLGVIGFIPMLLMGWETLKLIWQLNLLGQRQPYYFYQCSVVISGLGSLLIGSFFEAYLLGNMTFSIIAFLLYLVMGGYLIEVDRVRTYYYMQQAAAAAQTEQPGVYQ